MDGDAFAGVGGVGVDVAGLAELLRGEVGGTALGFGLADGFVGDEGCLGCGGEEE